MTDKISIKEKLSELVNAPYSQELEQDFNNVIIAFNKLFSEEKEKEEEIEEDNKEAIELFEKNKALNADILQLIQDFKNNKSVYKDAIKAEEVKNAELKSEIISDFRKLVEEEENLGALFGKVKEIRDQWNEIGNVPQKVFQKLQTEYSKINEDFNYNVNIYKALQDNDLKKNYSLKNQVIHQVKELSENSKIKELEKQVRVLQNKWDEIGPTYKEHWEKLKEDYWTNVQKIYDKIKAHYEDQKEVQLENLKKKKELIESLKVEVAKQFDKHQDWDVATKAIIALQEQWKKIGFVPKEENETIWNEFRTLSNGFFDRKSEFYKGRNDVFSKNAELKQNLVDRLDKLKDSTEWRDTAESIKKIQNEWKKIGHAGRANEQKLWKAFRSKCDAFFEARTKHFEELDASNEGNLKLKEDLISKIEAFKPLEDAKETLGKLKDFSKDFLAIGNVPFKEKDRVYKAYKTALDNLYDGLNLDKVEKEKAMFEAKMETLKSSVNPAKAIQVEKDKIRKRITELTKEIANYENNLGFFSASKGSESLFKGVQGKIDSGKANIDRLKKQLKLFPKLDSNK